MRPATVFTVPEKHEAFHGRKIGLMGFNGILMGFNGILLGFNGIEWD